MLRMTKISGFRPKPMDTVGTSLAGIGSVHGYVALLTGGHYIIKPSHPSLYFGYIDALSALFFLIVWIKSEKPLWRWGKKRIVDS